MFTESHLQAFDSVIRQLGITAYLCGGTVRDLLLGRPFRDIDVVLSKRVFEAAELFSSRIDEPFFILDRERKVARVVCDTGGWDFSGFRNHSIEGDLEKRDFTINALALRWEDFFPSRSLQTLVDPFGGFADVQKKVIRTVTPESLREDPLRMLRAYRIEAELQFVMDESVREEIARFHSGISGVAAERITEELDRILDQPDSARAWRALGESPLFDSLFPELKPMKGCEQGGYHHLDVWSHSVLALENFEELLTQISKHFPENASLLQEYLEATPGTLDRKRLLKWAILLHDIGKPQTKEWKEPGRWRFHGHDHAGADLAQGLLKRLKFARKDTHLIALMIEQHLRPLNLFDQEETDTGNFFRFFRAVGPEAPGILLLSYGDLAAARGPLADPNRDVAFIELLRKMIRYYYEEFYPAVNTPELVKGRDLMVAFQMQPGPSMGELLKEIREEQLAGALKDREEALEFARNWLKGRNI